MAEEGAGDLHILEHSGRRRHVQVAREYTLPDPELEDLDDVLLSERTQLLEALGPVGQEPVKHAEEQIPHERLFLDEFQVGRRKLDHELVRWTPRVDLLR